MSDHVSLDLLKKIANACPMCVIVHRLDDLEDDRTFRIVYANDSTEAQLRVKPSDLIGHLCEELFPTLREQGYIARLVRVLETGKAEDYEDYYHVDDRIAAVFAGHIEPIGEGTTATWFENVTLRKEIEAEAARARGLQQEIELRDRLAQIERQQGLIEALSAPILELWDDVIALPIVGALDGRRAEVTMRRLLDEISNKAVRFALLDLTGVEAIDTATAEHVVRLAQAVGLLGAKAIITGIQPAIAQTIVELGIDLNALETRRNLQEGLRDCLGRVARQRAPARRG